MKTKIKNAKIRHIASYNNIHSIYAYDEAGNGELVVEKWNATGRVVWSHRASVPVEQFRAADREIEDCTIYDANAASRLHDILGVFKTV